MVAVPSTVCHWPEIVPFAGSVVVTMLIWTVVRPDWPSGVETSTAARAVSGSTSSRAAMRKRRTGTSGCISLTRVRLSTRADSSGSHLLVYVRVGKAPLYAHHVPHADHHCPSRRPSPRPHRARLHASRPERKGG